MSDGKNMAVIDLAFVYVLMKRFYTSVSDTGKAPVR